MQSGYAGSVLLGEASNFISQAAEILVCAAYEYRDVVCTKAASDEDCFIGDKDLFQRFSHGCVLGCPSCDSKQRRILGSERIRIELEIRRRMNFKPSGCSNQDCGFQFRNLFTQGIEERPDADVQSVLYL